MKQIPVALQMYTLREEVHDDGLASVLKTVADIGYQGVEFAGYGDLTPEEAKKVLDDLGLKAASNHVPLDLLEKDLSAVIEAQHALESKHVVCPFLMPDKRTEEDYYHVIKILNEVGKTCKSEGLYLSYHNHDFELTRLSNGKTALATILDETNPEWVNAEFDIYWLTRAGEDPLEWIKRYPGRTPLVHLKDMTRDDEKYFAELGTGGVDVDHVLQEGEAAKVEWWIVEQDQSKRSPFESIDISRRYLREKGI
ncbi:sugar phosphate isomerase/epimerase family protein [Camelliibacillus cellulosilyticus]|uniref:Sugar phosphate isomerase/epimerase family protein n=1 Tax=Camelliibacillus cellulosilyticus TaxID=2174486 RepID=A0ABV9GPD2_9BACL